MTYKRQIDRLPIVPKDAKEFNVVCHYCIVGCGYKAYTWAVNKQGGTAPDENKFGVDLGKQQPAETAAWYSPSMYNIVRQNGDDVNIVIKPDKECVVNSGLGSVRGARMAEMSFSPRVTHNYNASLIQWFGVTARCNRPVGMMRSTWWHV
jgi:arsenite oxidase large subunit